MTYRDTTLQRLVDRGWLDARPAPTPRRRDDIAYDLTTAGRDVLEADDRLQELP